MSDPNITGNHTDRKLSVIEEYIKFYATALKDQGFSLVYIDAFAGTGHRKEKTTTTDLISEYIEPIKSKSKKGSAVIALEATPPMHIYVFFEKDAKRFEQLKALEKDYPDKKIAIAHGDANKYVQKLCKELQWRGVNAPGRGMRAVLFLDPFGMSVNWETLKIIAATKAIDVWYLFPTHAVLRQTPKDPAKLDVHKEASLTRILGGDWWRNTFYEEQTKENRDDLFTFSNVDADYYKENAEVRTATAKDVDNAFRNKLREIFPYVCDKPLVLKNHNVDMFSLFFAVSNDDPKAIGLARKASEYILKQAEIADIHSKSGLYNLDQ